MMFTPSSNEQFIQREALEIVTEHTRPSESCIQRGIDLQVLQNARLTDLQLLAQLSPYGCLHFGTPLALKICWWIFDPTIAQILPMRSWPSRGSVDEYPAANLRCAGKK